MEPEPMHVDEGSEPMDVDRGQNGEKKCVVGKRGVRKRVGRRHGSGAATGSVRIIDGSDT
jgi:hypothetical protein